MAATLIKSKNDLKLVIDDLSMLLVQSSNITMTPGTGNTATLGPITPDYELPVTVDTLQTNGGEPTINHYKVIGLDTDWTSSSTPGEWTVQFTVPTLNTDVLKFAFGDASVGTVSGSIEAMNDSGGNSVVTAWSNVTGSYVNFSTNKINCSLVIMNGAKDKMVVFRSVDLYAHLMKEANGDPYCVQFTGTVVSDGYDMLVLQKGAAVSSGD